MTLTDDYVELTSRNTGLVSDSAQQRLQDCTVLVAGCGSTGGAPIEPLARIGVGRLILVEPGTYELNNLNRQHAYRNDIGANKAQAAADRVLAINPDCQVDVIPMGVTAANAPRLVGEASIVIDGVDVTTRSGWAGKHALHVEAAARGLTVVSGWDLATTQYVKLYRYTGRHDETVLEGITDREVADQSVWALAKRVLPAEVIPDSLVEDIQVRGSQVEEYSVPQLVQTSLLFGAVATQAVLNFAEQVSQAEEEIVIDLKALTTGLSSSPVNRARGWFDQI